MPNPADLVYQTSTSTGNANLVLAPVNGRRTFAAAFGTGTTLDVFDYYISNNGIVGQTLDEWELGTGHMADATTLVRDTISRSTNSATFNATISGTTLTVVGAVTSGTISAGQNLYWSGLTGASPKIVSGSGSSWVISSSQTLATSTSIIAYGPVSYTSGIKDITNDIPAAIQLRTSTNLVTDGHGVVFSGTTGNLIKSLNAAPQPLNTTLTSLGGLTLANGSTLYATAANTLAALAAGTNGNVLKLASGIPSWGAPFSINTKTYTTVGSGPTVPANVYTAPIGLVAALIICTGGGGGGSGAANHTANAKTMAAGGGGGGSTAISLLSAATIGTAAINITIGAGGTRGTGSNTSTATLNPQTGGGNGTASSFGSLLTAGGGSGGNIADVLNTQINIGTGGAGGSASVGQILLAGQAGTSGLGNYTNTIASTAMGGAGGSSFWGGGVAGRGLKYATGGISLAGTDATLYGTGGSGASINTNAVLAGANGGSGASGYCVVFEFIAA